MKCPSCGTTSRIREKDKFCHNCGMKLKNEKETVTEKILLKAEVDMTEIDDALSKTNELCEALQKANSLLKELALMRREFQINGICLKTEKFTPEDSEGVKRPGNTCHPLVV